MSRSKFSLRAFRVGSNLHTTIDANLQMIVEKYLKQFDDEQKDSFTSGNGAENTGCVMMNVNTGEVLAMASYPPYDSRVSHPSGPLWHLMS